MPRALHLIWLLAAVLISPASAQTFCPEGKTATGACVNPGLAASARLDSMIFAQPKISSTTYPILPSLDFLYRYPWNVIPDPTRPSQTLAPPPAPPSS